MLDAHDDFAALARLLRAPSKVAGERCDFCAAPVEGTHPHLVDLKARRILCGCRACALTFEPAGAARGRFKRIPERYARIDLGDAGDALWEGLPIPIGLVFFLRNSADATLRAFYPGPAGATESELVLPAWESLVAAYPIVGTVADDVEAVLIRRRGTVTEGFVVPIDAAYELVGLIRTRWRGFDGGSEVGAAIDDFFARVEARA